jgi:hypothetical protein
MFGRWHNDEHDAHTMYNDIIMMYNGTFVNISMSLRAYAYVCSILCVINSYIQ